MRGLRIGRRRGKGNEQASSPLELALRPALVDGRWHVPDRFNFTRDVVEALARDPKRRALTFLSGEGIIEHRSFLEIAEGAAVWARALRERDVGSGDRVIVMAGTTVDWLEAVLGTWKVGGVVVPGAPGTKPPQLERLVSSTDAVLVVTDRSHEGTIERMGFSPDVHYYDDGAKRDSKDVPAGVPSQDTAARDLAFIVSTSGVGGSGKDVAHTHGSVFATRVQAEHWLDVGRGDAVWCTSDSTSPLTIWNTVVGPWSRGAEAVLQQGDFDVDERLDLMFRLGPSILCQSPAEYRALAEHRKLERFRSPRLRRLVSTGDYLEPEIVAVFEERWGMTIADGYGQAETNIVVANLADGAAKPGSLGRAVPGHHVAVIDDQGNELPAGIEGDLAVRGRPPTLFAGYWELAEETKSAFVGDWYLTGDVAHMDEEGFFTFVGRAEDVITSSGRTFGPYDVERALAGHPAIAHAAIVGIRDLQRGGHFVRAFVVPRGAAGGSEQLEAELRQFAAETLPDQQVPREIVFVDALPTVAWKVSRHELRERPLEGRPLWETPATEPEPAADLPTESEASPAAEIPVAQAPPAAFAPEPEPIVVEPLPEPVLLEPELVVEPVPIVEEIVPEQRPEPETFVAEALPEPEPEPEPVAEALPEPQPVVEVATAPEPDPEPEQPTLVAVPEPEPTEASAPEPDTPEVPTFRVVDSPTLPDFVVPEPDGAPPVVVPEPEPETDLTAPLPEYVVEPGTETAPLPLHEPEPEEEEDLGPLPDYVIDPSNPQAVRPAPQPPPSPAPGPAFEPPRPESAVEETPSRAAGLYFPPATAFPTPRADRDDDDSRESRRAARMRPAAEVGNSKRPTEPAEPGDEGGEVSWMQGLSNRLSAYSLSEDELPPAEDPDDDTT